MHRLHNPPSIRGCNPACGEEAALAAGLRAAPTRLPFSPYQEAP
jgi:hypothetical protein